MPQKPSISVFFPAYNEEKNIQKSIEESLKVLRLITDTYEVIVVNDGSKDRTKEVVEEYIKTNSNVKLVNHEVNRGYGEGLKSGIKACKYDYIFFTDADLQFDLSELEVFAQMVPKYDMVIGYRKHRSDPFIRTVNAKLWNVANRVLFGLKVRDIDCAFKLFRRDLAQGISLSSGGAMTSAEMLLKMNDVGATMTELPVSHLPRKAGTQTGAKLHVILRAFREMWRLYSVEMGEKTQIQFIKFAIVGALNTLTTLLVYIFLTRIIPFFPTDVVIAEILSYIAGIIVSFKFNRRWTFREHWKTNYKEVLRFLVTTLSALVANAIIFYMLLKFTKINDILAVITSALFTIAWNFILSKYWVFKRRKLA